MGVTSGGVWNVDPQLLWLLNCVIKRRGQDMWGSVRNLPCCCSPRLLPLWGTWQLVFVECGRSLNDSFSCVHFVSSPEIKRFQWMSTACIRQAFSLTPTLNSMLHSSLMPNVNSLMGLKECTLAFDLVEPFLLIASPSSHLRANNTTQSRISPGADGDVKGCQFSVVKFLMFLTQHQTRWSPLTLWSVIFVVYIIDLLWPIILPVLVRLGLGVASFSQLWKKRTHSASRVCKSAPISSCLPGSFEGTLSPAPSHHVCLAPLRAP